MYMCRPQPIATRPLSLRLYCTLLRRCALPLPCCAVCCAVRNREELVKLGLSHMLSQLAAAAGQDTNLMRYIQRAQLKLGALGQ